MSKMLILWARWDEFRIQEPEFSIQKIRMYIEFTTPALR